MRVFLTGGTGFIGGAVARQLRDGGHEVVALVRDPGKATALAEAGVELVRGDLTSADRIAAAAQGCDAAIHGAAIYRIGVTSAQAGELERTNVDGTANTLDGLVQAGIPRIVYISTAGVFGNTHGRVVDETYRRDLGEGFLSAYDETKYRAHELALTRIAAGAPIILIQPTAVYGPNDHSELGTTIVRAAAGKLPALPFSELGLSMVHVDDVASGIILALENGRLGEAYILSGENATMGDVVARACELAGRRPPRLKVPTVLLKALAPAGALVGPAVGMPRNLRELISASDGVTYYAGHERATSELAFRPRSIADGLASAL